jgi:ADP-ribose pyrophosphatase YjhB (NUDIX family)
VRVSVQAVVVRDDQLVVVRERHRGVERLVLPGGRVHDRESTTNALVRAVAQATRIEVDPTRLLYVAEVRGRYDAHDLHLVWLAEPRDPDVVIPEHTLVELGADPHASLNPPIMNEIAADAEDGWTHNPRWLENIGRNARELR